MFECSDNCILGATGAVFLVWDIVAMPKLEKAKVWKCLQKPASVKDQKKLKIVDKPVEKGDARKKVDVPGSGIFDCF